MILPHLVISVLEVLELVYESVIGGGGGWPSGWHHPAVCER